MSPFLRKRNLHIALSSRMLHSLSTSINEFSKYFLLFYRLKAARGHYTFSLDKQQKCVVVKSLLQYLNDDELSHHYQRL
jgi:hypothetical protein